VGEDRAVGQAKRVPETTTWHHDLHDRASLLVFVGLAAACLAAACLAVAFRVTGLWRVHRVVTGVAMLVLFAVYGQRWTQDAANAGLVQRILIVTGWTRLTLLAAYLLRRKGETTSPRGVDPGPT
jgi:hypothetical protein